MPPSNTRHGKSTTLYRHEDYTIAAMASDARALLDHLGIARADLIGYSMGARICAYLAAHESTRVRAAVLAGVGLSLIGGRDLRETIAAALEAPSLDTVTDPTGRTFRAFAEQTRSDLRALAACIRGSSERLSRTDAAAIKVPVLIAAGTTDDVAGPVRPLAELVPGAQVLGQAGTGDHVGGGPEPEHARSQKPLTASPQSPPVAGRDLRQRVLAELDEVVQSQPEIPGDH